MPAASAGSWTDGEGCNDFRIGCVGKLNHTLPLSACEHTVEALRRSCRRGIVRVLEEGCVGPRPADAEISRAQSRGQLAQTRVGEVDWRPVLIERRVHAGGLIGAGLLCGWTRVGFAGVRLPKAAAGYFDHLNVIGLEALIDRADARHGCRSYQRGPGILRRNETAEASMLKRVTTQNKTNC